MPRLHTVDRCSSWLNMKEFIRPDILVTALWWFKLHFSLYSHHGCGQNRFSEVSLFADTTAAVTTTAAAAVTTTAGVVGYYWEIHQFWCTLHTKVHTPKPQTPSLYFVWTVIVTKCYKCSLKKSPSASDYQNISRFHVSILQYLVQSSTVVYSWGLYDIYIQYYIHSTIYTYTVYTVLQNQVPTRTDVVVQCLCIYTVLRLQPSITG